MFSKKINYIVTIFFVVICMLVNFFSACNISSSKNEMQTNQIELGWYLFYDRRLSINNTRSCGTCHNPQFAFTDGYKRSLGAFADLHNRNTQPLFNLNNLKYLTAADSNIHSALQQIENPLFNEHVIEMGVKRHEVEILNRIITDSHYQSLFTKAGYSFNWKYIKLAISQFEQQLVSYNAPYDKFINGDTGALNASEKAGKNLFFSAALQCASCHGGKNFTTPIFTEKTKDTVYYYNIGLYNVNNNNEYPLYDQGLYEQTKNTNDMGKFRVPTLRNLAFTAPYFHDGSAASLQDVISHYASGGRIITSGEYIGNGNKNIFKHPFIKGFSLTEKEKLNLINFLLSLSDSSFVKNPLYQNPFTEDETKY